MDDESEPVKRRPGHPGGEYNTPLSAWLTAHPEVTARVLAEEVGITETYVGHIRRGLTVPSLRVMFDLERVTKKIESDAGAKEPVGVLVEAWTSLVRAASEERPKKRGARSSKAVRRGT